VAPIEVAKLDQGDAYGHVETQGIWVVYLKERGPPLHYGAALPPRSANDDGGTPSGSKGQSAWSSF
jgi:hypothetical protein